MSAGLLPAGPRPLAALPTAVPEELAHLYGQGALTLAGRCRELAAPQPWKRLLTTLRDKEWIVYAKEPVREPQHVLQYLARYGHRVAIANHRLVALEDGQVTFRFKDYKRCGQLRTQTLDAVEFLRRFVLHVLPSGLHQVRYFGFLANCHRQHQLTHCRTLLGQSTDAVEGRAMAADEGASEPPGAGMGGEPGAPCPVCHHGRMQLVEAYYRQQAAWDLSVAAPGIDTS
jgi:Putative transposase